jgi:chromosome segregation ATPase
MAIRGLIYGIVVAAIVFRGVAVGVEATRRPVQELSAEEREARVKAHREQVAEARRKQLEEQQSQEAEMRRIVDETTPAAEKEFQSWDLAKVQGEQASAKAWLDMYPSEARRLTLAAGEARQGVIASDPAIVPIQKQIDDLQSQIYDLQSRRNTLVDQNETVKASVAAVQSLRDRQREMAVWEQKLRLRAEVLAKDAVRTDAAPDADVKGEPHE